MICPLANFEEIFQTQKGAVYQCSRKNCYWLDFKGSTTAFKVRDFFAFKKRIDSINIEKMLTDPSRSADFEIIMPFRTDSIFVLSVDEVLTLKEILAGAKFMIELNSEIKACLNSKAVLAF